MPRDHWPPLVGNLWARNRFSITYFRYKSFILLTSLDIAQQSRLPQHTSTTHMSLIRVSSKALMRQPGGILSLLSFCVATKLICFTTALPSPAPTTPPNPRDVEHRLFPREPDSVCGWYSTNDSMAISRQSLLCIVH